jgi:hypothetical protein
VVFVLPTARRSILLLFVGLRITVDPTLLFWLGEFRSERRGRVSLSDVSLVTSVVSKDGTFDDKGKIPSFDNCRTGFFAGPEIRSRSDREGVKLKGFGLRGEYDVFGRDGRLSRPLSNGDRIPATEEAVDDFLSGDRSYVCFCPLPLCRMSPRRRGFIGTESFDGLRRISPWLPFKGETDEELTSMDEEM